jgi:hypothetical protein
LANPSVEIDGNTLKSAENRRTPKFASLGAAPFFERFLVG